ncbi:MAG: hypothetical protein ACREE6_02445 [Limisphaerales bacterium]
MFPTTILSLETVGKTFKTTILSSEIVGKTFPTTILSSEIVGKTFLTTILILETTVKTFLTTILTTNTIGKMFPTIVKALKLACFKAERIESGQKLDRMLAFSPLPEHFVVISRRRLWIIGRFIHYR